MLKFARSAVIDLLMEEAASKNVSVAYFSFSRESKISRNVMIATLLAQLCVKTKGDLLNSVLKLYHEHEKPGLEANTLPSPDELGEAFLAAYSGFSETFVVLDTFKKWDITSLESQELVGWVLTNASLKFITSGRKFDLQELLMLPITIASMDQMAGSE